jgi:hypothetical protein
MPRYMVGRAAADAWRWTAMAMRRQHVKRLVTELRLAYVAGYWRERRRRIDPAPPENGLRAQSAC